MSWQGNECFVQYIETICDDCDTQMAYNLSELLYLFNEKGIGWYLLGNLYTDGLADDCDDEPFEPLSFGGSAPSCSCWIPNPFMHPYVLAIEIRKPSDLIEAAFELWDWGFDCAAYAGDGCMPLQHMVVGGKTFDMRPEGWR